MRLNRKLVAGTAAGLAVAGGGAAVAATQFGNPNQESQAIINDAAKRLGIQPAKLSDALKKALSDRIDAAVKAGRLTKEQGNALKARIESGALPLIPGGGPPHGGFFHGLDAAASYLGLTEAQLRAQLAGGKTLAQVAKDKGKSVDGLINALVDDAKKHLDQAVKQGKLTKQQEQSILKNVKQRVTDLVNGKLSQGPPPGGPRRWSGKSGHGFRGPWGPPPGQQAPAADGWGTAA